MVVQVVQFTNLIVPMRIDLDEWSGVLRGVTGCHWMSLDVTGCHWMSDVVGLSSEGEGFGGWCSRRKDSAGCWDGPRWSKCSVVWFRLCF